MEDKQEAGGPQRTRGSTFCSTWEEPLSKVTISQLPQLDFHRARVGRRAVLPHTASSEDFSLRELSTHIDQETSSHRQGWSGSAAGRRLQ